MKIDQDQLKRQGWHLTPEAVEDLSKNFSSLGDVMKHLLETDLRDVGCGWIPEGLRKSKIAKLEASGVLQVMKVRNISASKDHQDSKFAPRFLRIIATDGKESLSLLDMEHHPKLSIDTLPGAKILLKNSPELWDGHVIVKRGCVDLVGGSVQRLVEAWRLKRDFSSSAGGGPLPRRAADGSGPPPFTPFGSRQLTRADKGFRAMDKVREATGQTKSAGGGGPGSDGEDDGDSEFDSHRRAVIEEARQQGKDMNTKLRGFAQQKNVKLPPGRGVDQLERQEEIKKVVAMGFQPRDAAAALRRTNGDVQKAVDSLLSDRTEPLSLGPERKTGRGRGRRGRGDPMDSDDEGPSRAPPPSGPATLADFVTKKASDKTPAAPESKPNPGPSRPGDDLSPGDNVMARWRDGRTYRARVEEVYRPDGVISVHFVDYGEHDVIPLEHVQPMQQDRGPRGPPSRQNDQPRQAYNGRGRDFGRGGRDFGRGGRDFGRGGRDFDRGGRDFDRGGRDFGRGGRDFDRGQRPPQASNHFAYHPQQDQHQQQQQRPRSGQPFYNPYAQYHDYRPQQPRKFEQPMGYYPDGQYPGPPPQELFVPHGMEFRRGGHGRPFSARGGRR